VAVPNLARGAQVARYLVLDRVGQGRAGVVYKAYDPGLGRTIALKLLETGDRAERLMSEAQALARLQHPNVVAVHDVGTFQGHVFLAMDFVEGQRLSAWLEKPRTRSEMLEVFLAAARGVADAQRAGLSHAGFEPGDVMLGRDGRVRVLDLGLFGSDERATARGAGTAHELCLSLRSALDAAASDAGSKLPEWLGQVLARGLEREPARRYPSMAALVEALEADPSAARTRRLRALLGVMAAVAVAGAVFAGGVALRARRGAAAQARLAQQFGQEIEKISAIARYAAFLPLHDTRRELDAIRTRMDQLRARMRVLGPIADGPGHHALGRGALALERYEDALKELEAAYGAGYRSPELADALGIVHGKLYQRALAELPKISDPKLDAARRAELARAHRDPALRYLKEAGARDAGAEPPEYVEGLIALYERRFDQALALARRARERVSWLFEARTLEGDIHSMAGQDLHDRGDIDGAFAEYTRAGEAYRAVVAAARSSAAAYLGDCRRLAAIVDLLAERDQPPRESLEQALSVCNDAVTARPDDPAPLTSQAAAWRRVANYDNEHGVDPAADSEQAIRLSTRALALDPSDLRAELVIADSYNELAVHHLEQGADPRPELAQGIRHARRALALSPTFLDAYLTLDVAENTIGNWEFVHGIDPRPSYRAALGHAKQALELSPVGYEPTNDLGQSEWHIGQWEMSHGGDPTAAFTAGLEAYRAVARRTPSLDYGHVNVCGVRVDQADYERRRGRDPSAILDEAISSCRRALALNQNYQGTHFYLALAYLQQALWGLEHGVDPGPKLEKSRGELVRAIEIHRLDSDLAGTLGQTWLLEARWQAARGRDPRPALAAAERLSLRSRSLSSGELADAEALLAEVKWRRAEWLGAHKLAVAAEVQEGLGLAARALAKNPLLGVAAADTGMLHLIVARTAARPADRAAAAERAAAAFRRAFEIDANLEPEFRAAFHEATALGPSRKLSATPP
jgi:hypothetical protein